MTKKIILGAVILMFGMVSSLSAGLNTQYGIRVNDTLPTKPSNSYITVGYKNSSHKNNIISTGWEYAFKKAILEFNNESRNAGSIARFLWRGNYSPDIKLEYSYLTSSIVAKTNIGDRYHGVGKKLIINSNLDRTLSYTDKKTVAKHELMHAIGFRYSRTGSEISDGSVEVPNTNSFWEWQYYGKSIMQEGFHNLPENLSELDKRALKYIFPN